jgi:ribA/ribD-fused uncharacterized protein
MTSHNEKFYENEDGIYFKSGYPSQWYETSFIIDGKQYNCCEKYMMEQKALYFKDYEIAEKIMNTNDPKEHKQLGREVKGFNETKWNTVADEIVFNANLAKFTQDIQLKNKLLATGDKMFVECSPYDKIWGNGLNITDTLNTPMNKWLGTNRLGLAIMKVRNTLRTL